MRGEGVNQLSDGLGWVLCLNGTDDFDIISVFEVFDVFRGGLDFRETYVEEERTEPWATPDVIGKNSEWSPSK